MIRFLKNLVVHDFWLKFLSLALAIAIWKIVAPTAYNEKPSPAASLVNPDFARDWSFQIPVTVKSAAADVRDFEVSPSEVEVTVRGNPKTIRQTELGKIRALVDLTGIEPTPGLQIKMQIQITTPPGVSYVDVSPDTVEVVVPPQH